MAPSDKPLSERNYETAALRMTRLRRGPLAVTARYDGKNRRVIVSLSTGVDLAFPPDMAEGLAGASAADLGTVEVTPSGLGLHWPGLDADLYLPSLLAGVFGTKKWAAAALGTSGGRVRTPRKASAARENGKRGGRPRKGAAGG